MVSHWSLSDNKSPQVSRPIFRIMTNLNKSVVWSIPLLLLFPSPPVSLSRLCWVYRELQFRLVLPLLSRSIVFFREFWQSLGTYLSFPFLRALSWGLSGRQSPLFGRSPFYCWLSLCMVIWSRLGDPLSQNPKKLCASYFPGYNLGCTYTICS